MAITITEIFRGRQFGVGEDFQSTYTRVFLVDTGDVHVEGVAIKAALGLAIGQGYSVGTAADPGADPPVAGDAWHKQDAGAVIKSVDGSCDSPDGRQWTITVQYGPWTSKPREENPLDEPEEVEIGGEQRDRICDRDRTGAAVVNSAGDYFDPPVVRDESRPTLTIVRNEAYDSPDLSAEYSDTINDANFFGADAGTVKCGTITRRRQWHQAVPGGFYWKTTYPFSLNRDGWRKSILDQGLRQVVSGARKQITVDGQLATSPVLLNGSGAILAVAGTPVYRGFDVYEAKDFGAFGFVGA
jgi:hypothetical protein